MVGLKFQGKNRRKWVLGEGEEGMWKKFEEEKKIEDENLSFSSFYISFGQHKKGNASPTSSVVCCVLSGSWAPHKTLTDPTCT